MRGISAHGEPPRYFTFDALAAAGVSHLTTTRHFPGVSSPAEPTAPFTAAALEPLAGAGLDGTRLAYARQVHGAAVVRAPASGGYAGDADILASAARALALAVVTADCLPLVLVDLGAPGLVVAHVGWRGTVVRAQQAAVRALSWLGGSPARARVAIGPSIGPCCYEVDQPVIDAVTGAHGPRARQWMTPARTAGRVLLDLWSANEALLADVGVDRARIENPRLCTACRPDLLYSYRMGHRGRLVTVAALP